MYLCICNAISDRRVHEAVAAGAENWVDVHAYAGCQPNCGQCADDITAEIDNSRSVVAGKNTDAAAQDHQQPTATSAADRSQIASAAV